MKFKITIIFILISSFMYSEINITGKVSDSTNSPVEFATIVLKNGTKTIGNTFTNEKGNYAIKITDAGTYSLLVYYIGFNTKSMEVSLTNDTTIDIHLTSSGEYKLQEVIVVNKNMVIERKIDRIVFNVANSVAATGGDAIDALKITPGVLVKNDLISMVGKNGLRVMINNKLLPLSGDELTNFLKSIPVSNISKIEVISNPSAKYDADGNSGLVNIILKTAYRDSWNSSINGTYLKNTFSSGRGGANFNYQRKKLSFYSNIGLSDGARRITDQSKMYYPDQLWSNRSPRKVSSNSLTGGLGIDYAVSPKFQMGFQYMGSRSGYMIRNNSRTTLYNNSTGFIDSTLNTNSKTNEVSGDHSFNINSTVNLDSIGKKITFNLDYFNYRMNNDGTFANVNHFSDETQTFQSYYAAHNTNNQRTDNYSGKVDVEFPVKWINLSYGGKVSSTTTDNAIGFYNATSGTEILDSSRTNTFIYNEHNEALYLSGDKKLGKKWEAQVGLRGEYTQTKGDSRTLNQINNYSYIKLFPTVYISFTPNDSNSFVLSYGRRINRPNYDQLNPFRMYSNPYLYVEGNPFLQPSFSDNIELSHTHKNLNSKLYYSSITNGFQQLPIIDPNSNLQRISVQNFYNTHSIGLSESYMFNKFAWWESTNSLDVFYSRSRSTSPITQAQLESFNAFLTTSNDFILSKSQKFLFNISYWYNFPGNADLAKSTASSQLDVSLKMLLLKKKLTIAISGQDILGTNRPTYTMYSNNVKLEYKNYYDSRCIRVSLAYHFGNNNIRVTEKDFGNADEKQRVGN